MKATLKTIKEFFLKDGKKIYKVSGCNEYQMYASSRDSMPVWKGTKEDLQRLYSCQKN